MLKSIFLGNANRASPRYPDALLAIFEWKMSERFGSYSEYLAAPATTVQRMWLVFEAELAAQEKQARDAEDAARRT